MQNIGSAWQALTMQRRIIVIAATVSMFALVLGVARMASTPSLALLYSGLESQAAGEVVQALEQTGVVYDVRGGAIFVEEGRRDELRMTLASEGLPANASQGYELLDQLSGFGTTSQMFDAAYWRAKEGELARTIVASPAIQSARVHIANAGTRPFQRDVRTTASITVTPAGGGLAASHARALRYLVAAAVSGLSPEDVSVIDATGGVILAGEDRPEGAVGADRAAQLKRNVERLLEARVGYGNAVVEVNVETVTESEQILERTIDPESRVAISSDVTQSNSSSTNPAQGDVTVASNLPDGDAAADGQGGGGSDNATESRETTNFEVSQIERQVTRSPGAIARVTTAVLVDGLRETGEDGALTWTPRPEEEMEALRELVSAAIGFDAERGDSLSVRSMQFEPLPGEGTAPLAAAGMPPLDMMRLAQIAILGLVALALGLFVVRPILAKSGASAQLAPPLDTASDGAEEALNGEIFFGNGFGDDDSPFGGFGGDAGEDEERSPVDRLRELIEERQEESLEILKSWMEDEGKKA